MTSYNIVDFGAVGNGSTDNAHQIQTAIDKCTQNGGGTVIFPAGNVFLCGPIDLKSNVNLYLEANAILRAHPDESKYQKSAFRENIGEGTIWIGGEHAKSISITGMGCIDGNHVAFMGQEQKAAFDLKPFKQKDPRPHVLTLIDCERIIVRDVTFQNSAYWCIHLAGCQDILISGVRIYNSLKVRNCDGIDLDHCKNVRIADCFIKSGDDCICLKNRREYAEFGPCENITVTGCVLTSTSCSIKLGSENMDVIRNVIVDNCIITASNRGIGLQHRDEGSMENITFSNIQIESRLFNDIWWGKAEPLYITAFKRAAGNGKDQNWRFAKGQHEGNVGRIRDIHFMNIHCQSENGVYIAGEPGKISHISFDKIIVELNKTTSYLGNKYDRRPCNIEGLLETDISGFMFDTVDDINLSACEVRWGENTPQYYSSALSATNIASLQISHFHGSAAHEGIEPIKLKNCMLETEKDIR